MSLILRDSLSIISITTGAPQWVLRRWVLNPVKFPVWPRVTFFPHKGHSNITGDNMFVATPNKWVKMFLFSSKFFRIVLGNVSLRSSRVDIFRDFSTLALDDNLFLLCFPGFMVSVSPCSSKAKILTYLKMWEWHIKRYIYVYNFISIYKISTKGNKRYVSCVRAIVSVTSSKWKFQKNILNAP